ncbi:thrombospondin type-1 domain-containing protein 4 [Boleophthalmus pectinirostris]|uniref:thrombospondin type-1 domain-containing protein 4 n=1 Tax=Boleophthalmus pectinirostris TaxID=150288 RepID=UPI00242D0C37|nr:thrombospondin type-1 domain-containing protein 4 [Boleophthalmus pectinirostris]
MSECSYEGVRHNAFVRVSVILLVLHSETLKCQHTTDHRKVPHRVVPHQETRADQGNVPGSWGAWGPWTSCSRTCAKGVQEQSRPCLRVFPHEYPSTRTRANPQQPGHVISPANYNPFAPRRQQLPGRAEEAQSFPIKSTQPEGAGPGPQAENNQEIQPGNPQPERPYDPLPVSFCNGEHARYKICTNSACLPSSRTFRAVQCSSYNSKPFMGRLYEWEPFNEAPVEQQCELHCRAVGFRFYVRLSKAVTDGTPCVQNHSTVCVAGKCMSPGCDEYLGSGKSLDRCGVCGGDNTTCRLVSGVFKHSLSKMGYHKIVEIPEGATKINITEMAKSRNYLALRSRSGRSIINGNWAIDRPGKYEGGGTMFTYRRPNEISSTTGESFVAEGPTNEILDVYMIFQQLNPGVLYEYILPFEKTDPRSNNKQEGNGLNREGGFSHHNNVFPHSREGEEIGRYSPRLPDNQVTAVLPPRQDREYSWKLAGSTECSASCGKGFRYSVFHCVHHRKNLHVSDTLCDTSHKPSAQEEACNLQPCPAFWDIGEWSECSKTCGLGMQQRQILCRQVYANHTLNVHMSRCQHLERPETTSTCQMKICSEWQIRSAWSPCSVPCGLGQRTREVHCVSNVGDIVPDDECNMHLRPVHVENCDSGPCAKSWFYTEWGNRCSAECGMGVRTRGVLCLTNHITSLPLEGCGSERPPDSQVCNNGPCENGFEWFTGPWSQCSVECGTGSQQRSVVCLMKSDEGFTIVPPYECSSLERPLSQQSCKLKACGAKWYHTDWSSCSKTCEGGFRVREVRCLSDGMLSSEKCDETIKPEVKEDCNPEPCIPHKDDKCRDKYFNCNVVVQARLCVYDYYKTTCCASCSRVAHRLSHHKSRS